MQDNRDVVGLEYDRNVTEQNEKIRGRQLSLQVLYQHYLVFAESSNKINECSHFLLKIYLTVTERERDKSPSLQFTFQVACNSWDWTRLKPGAWSSFESPIQVTGNLDHLPLLFPSHGQIWIGRTTRTRTGTHMRCWYYKWWFYSLCHNIGPTFPA